MSLQSAIAVRHARCKYLSMHVKSLIRDCTLPSFIQPAFSTNCPVLGLFPRCYDNITIF